MSSRIELVHIDLSRSFHWRERQTFLLIRELQKRRSLRQSVIVAKDSPLQKVLRSLDVEVHTAGWNSSTKLFKNVDIAHAHEPMAWRLAKRLKKAFIASCNSYLLKDKKLAKSACVFARSRSLIEQLHATMPQLPIERIPPMVDLDDENIYVGDDPKGYFAMADIEQLQGDLSGKFVFGCCTGLDDYCGVEQLIEAMRHLVTRCPQARLVVVGDGPRLSRLRAQARSIDAIIFTGPGTRLADCYKLFDAYVSPSLGSGDDNGVLQAMYCGLPIIASNLESMDDFVQNNISALLVASKDVPALSEAMEKIVADESLAFQLGTTAARHAEKFYPEYICEKVFEMYQSVMLNRYV